MAKELFETKELVERVNKAVGELHIVGQKTFTFKKKYDVNVRLTKNKLGKYEFSACGEVWRSASRKGDCESCGQCLDEIKGVLGDSEPLFNEIHSLWKKHHLNGLHSGTRKQEEFLNEYMESHGLERLDYPSACEVLKENDIYTDKLTDGTKHIYGSCWLYREIPSEDLESIKRILGVE